MNVTSSLHAPHRDSPTSDFETYSDQHFPDQVERKNVKCENVRNEDKDGDLLAMELILFKLITVASKAFAEQMFQLLFCTSLTAKNKKINAE